jgi:capsular polysaccharide biosynthesis protein
MNENKANYEFDVMQIIGMLLKKWWVIALAAILCAWLAFGYTEFFVTPTYQSSATLLINGDGSISSAYQQILAGQYQSKDYPYILKANDTLSEVAKELNTPDEEGETVSRVYTAGAISAMISSDSVEDSRIFRIIVKSTSPEEAKRVAAAVTKVFVLRAEDITDAEISVVDNPVMPRSPSSAGRGRNVLVGFLVGVVLGAAYAIVVGIINDTLDSEEWLLDKYKDRIALLAVVPDANADYKGKYYSRDKYKYSRTYGYTSKSDANNSSNGK